MIGSPQPAVSLHARGAAPRVAWACSEVNAERGLRPSATLLVAHHFSDPPTFQKQQGAGHTA